MSEAAKTRPPTTHRPLVPPPHLADWQLPPGWLWGESGLAGDQRHYQEVSDGLGRSLSLVTAPDPAHEAWLFSEALHLAHRSHPSIPTTYHYWTAQPETRRGPGYLRRWVTGETVRAHLSRLRAAEIPYVMQVLRGTGSTLAYLHDSGTTHGNVTAETVWTTPAGRLWMLEWQWAVPAADIPAGASPAPAGNTGTGSGSGATPPEWRAGPWRPTPATDQWQLAAMCFAALTGEDPPPEDVPPVRLLRPECPASVAAAIDRALLNEPGERFSSVGAMLRVADRGFASRTAFVAPEPAGAELSDDAAHETRVRMALGDDYEVLADLGAGSFGRVWRARDLSLEREVALKVLHPHIAADERAVGAFWREARLAAQLSHPGIVPIYDWDSRGELSWYTMELAEEGSLASLITRTGARSITQIDQQVESVLEALAAAHANGIVHRDLKPENVLIDRYGRWRLTDFGIANVTGEEVAGTTGTPAFAAPEQLLGESVGPAADLYALAGIVVFALTGSAPFGTGEPQHVLARQLAQDLDLSVFPPALADWLQCALAPDAENRFADAAAMLASWHVSVADAKRRERAPWWRLALG